MLKDNMLREVIKAASQNMQRLYEVSGHVGHPGEKGTYREFFIAQLIRPLLPPHFGIGSGVVVEAYNKKNESKQSDLIIYDRRLMPPILLAGDRGIFPIDSVLAVVEVKSILTASDYEDLVKAARLLYPGPHDHLRIATPGQLRDPKTDHPQAIYPLFSVFAYTSDTNGDEAERLEKRVPGGIEYVRLIGVLNKGVWWFKKGEGNRKGTTEHPNISNYEDICVEYVKLLLNRLEEAAESRGKFIIVSWLE